MLILRESGYVIATKHSLSVQVVKGRVDNKSCETRNCTKLVTVSPIFDRFAKRTKYVKSFFARLKKYETMF